MLKSCSYRTCKTIDNRSRDKVFMREMNFDRDFALARGKPMITKTGIFQKRNYLIMKFLSPVSHFCHFMMILSNHNEIQKPSNFYRKIFTSLS